MITTTLQGRPYRVPSDRQMSDQELSPSLPADGQTPGSLRDLLQRGLRFLFLTA